MTVVTHEKLPKKTVSGIVFDDVSAEKKRTYTFPEGEVTVENPLWLNVSKSGGHRIIVAGNSTVYIPTGWGKLQWWNKEGFEPLQF
jgi:hypothetical protein